MYRFFYLLAFLYFFQFLGCDSDREEKALRIQVDSLKSQLAATYKPGLGDFMGSIQVHHNKLWFAGQAENWELADFEIHEIGEAIDDIKQFQGDRKETAAIKSIQPALDSVTAAIAKKDRQLFTYSYTVLTNTCNQCHKAMDFSFNIVKVPTQPPFSNQSFSNIQ